MKSEKYRVTHGPDSPDEALRWKQIFERDENGVIAPDGLMNARRQVDAMKARDRAVAAALAASGGPLPSAAGISAGAWTWIGPGNIGGRTRAIAIHPTSTSTIFAGSVAGGIWKTTDGGANWNIVDDFMTNLSISSIVFQPGNPSVMFAGTGEGFSNGDAIRGAGIFKSVDGGTTWTQLPNTAPTTINQNFIFVNELAFAPDSSALLAATGSGIWRSTDLGGTWSKTLNVITMQDVKFLPGSSSLVVAGGQTKNVYYSTDGGASFQITASITPGASFARVELGVSASQPEVVYASIAAGGTSSTPPAELWKSGDSGVTYTMVNNQASSLLGAQGWYDNAIWVDPTNVNQVIVGGVSLWRSTDGGANFTVISGSYHSDQHVIVQDPGFDGTSNKRVYFGSDGGVYKLEDVTTTTFTKLNNDLGVTQFYGADGLTGNGKIFGGTQDNGTILYTGNAQAWTAIAGGDGGMATADRTNNYLYGEFQWLAVHRSSNGGASTTNLAGCGKAAPYQILTDACTSSSSTTNFIAPLLLDPNTPDRLLAGGFQLWRTEDPRTATSATTGPQWTSIKPSVGSAISAIAVANNNSDLVWVGHNNGNVYVSADGTSPAPTWDQRDTNSPGLPNRAVTSITVDPADWGTVYVSFGGFSTGNLWVTHDSGASWSDATGSGGSQLPAAPIRYVVRHPSIAGWVYVATDVGIFASEDGGASWHVPQDGPSNVAVFQLFFMGNTLVAVTHGRGLYTADVTAPSTPPTISTQPASQTIGAGQTAALSVNATGSSPLTYQWYQGTSPSTASPIGGATLASFTTPALSSTTKYWVRVTNGFGTADSNTATITVDPGIAIYNSTLKAPKCALVGSSCDSGPTLINGRANITGGPELNQPNTINNSCADGTSGSYHVDESLDRLKVSTVDGTAFAPGKNVTINATIWADATFFASDSVDFYGAPNAASPTWTYIGTVTATAGGAQTLSFGPYVLPAGTLQAVRANYRFGGSASSCTVGSFNDHDDLIFAVTPASGTEMVTNGDFSAGTTGWQLFEVPDIVSSVVGGVFQYYKASPTTTASGQAVVFQTTGQALPSFAPLAARFDIGNTDTVRKRISVLVIDSDFSDLSVCTFYLGPSAPLRTYQMKTHSTKAWSNASIYFYAATGGGSASASYLLDNVSLKYDAAGSAAQTTCVDPTAPAPPGGAAGANLLTNGDFSAGLAPWGPFFDITQQVNGGVFEFIRPGTPGQPAGGVLQSTSQAMTAGQSITASFQLGNSSAVRKRVTVLLHDLDFSDLTACTFWLPPGEALSTYTMRSYATKAWTNATLSVYAATTGPEQWTRLDTVTLQRTPGTAALGTECLEPVLGPEPALGAAAGTDGTGGLTSSTAEASVMTPAWQTAGSGGSSGPTFAPASGAGATWRAEAWTTGRAVLAWAEPIDLTTATSASLTFESSLAAGASSGAVQVSLDGVTWQTVASVPKTGGWTTVSVDLSAFVGQVICVRFVFDGVAPEVGVSPDVWVIGGVTVNGG